MEACPTLTSSPFNTHKSKGDGTYAVAKRTHAHWCATSTAWSWSLGCGPSDHSIPQLPDPMRAAPTWGLWGQTVFSVTSEQSKETGMVVCRTDLSVTSTAPLHIVMFSCCLCSCRKYCGQHPSGKKKIAAATSVTWNGFRTEVPHVLAHAPKLGVRTPKVQRVPQNADLQPCKFAFGVLSAVLGWTSEVWSLWTELTPSTISNYGHHFLSEDPNCSNYAGSRLSQALQANFQGKLRSIFLHFSDSIKKGESQEKERDPHSYSYTLDFDTRQGCLGLFSGNCNSESTKRWAWAQWPIYLNNHVRLWKFGIEFHVHNNHDSLSCQLNLWCHTRAGAICWRCEALPALVKIIYLSTDWNLSLSADHKHGIFPTPKEHHCSAFPLFLHSKKFVCSLWPRAGWWKGKGWTISFRQQGTSGNFALSFLISRAVNLWKVGQCTRHRERDNTGTYLFFLLSTPPNSTRANEEKKHRSVPNQYLPSVRKSIQTVAGLPLIHCCP